MWQCFSSQDHSTGGEEVSSKDTWCSVVTRAEGEREGAENGAPDGQR